MNNSNTSNLQIGIRLHDMEPVSLEERLVLAKEKGFTCAHLASKLIYSEYHIDRHGLTPGLAAHLRRKFSENGIDIAVYGCYLNLANPDPHRLHEIIEEYKANIRFAAWLGASLVGTETGAPNTEYTYCPQCHEEEALVFFLKNLKQVVDYAGSYGITIAIEPVWRHIIYNPQRTRIALDTIGRDHLQIIFDPVNMLAECNHLQQKELFHEMLELNGNDIVLLHAKDYTVDGSELIACAPGSAGNLDYSEILAWLKEHKPHLHVTMENTTPENAVEAMNFLKGF